jgi:ATP-dependent RNA helicase DeaD
VTPTRELARQVEEELAWLFAGCPGRVASVAGGASYRDEGRALAKGPALIVATPGRLLDHLKRGDVDPSQAAAVVLDEADRMLDLGFREDLEAILALLPPAHRTVLVSATFPRDVRALADRVQRKPVHVEATRLGTAHTDIDHVLHVVDPRQKVDAIVNLLLASPEAQTLVFAHTRSRVAEIAEELRAAGFAVASISGELDQRARNRALAGFKRGDLHVLVATDVAARGIDVQDIARVIQVDVPSGADSYTHRSGRTGRAGRKGISSLLVAPAGVEQALRLLGRAGVAYRFEAIPSASELRALADERVLAELTGDDAAGDGALDARTKALAARLVARGDLERAVARLLQRARRGAGAEPREVKALAPPERGARERARGPHPRRAERPGGFVPFRVSWGARHGADPRRLLALVCRRGGVGGHEIGAIDVGPVFSTVHVASGAAEAFARAAREPDPRDPRVLIRREGEAEARARAQRGHGAAPRRGPKPKPRPRLP